MTNDKMREEFEAWAAVKFAVAQDLLFASRTEEDMDSGFPYRIVNQHGEESDLVNTLVGTAWAGWQASRAAVVVEPVWPYHHDYTNSDVAGAAILDCCIAFNKAARNAGLKVKP